MELTILPNALAGKNLKDFRKEIKEKNTRGFLQLISLHSSSGPSIAQLSQASKLWLANTNSILLLICNVKIESDFIPEHWTICWCICLLLQSGKKQQNRVEHILPIFRTFHTENILSILDMKSNMWSNGKLDEYDF